MRNMVIEIQCVTRIFDTSMKSVSDFYRKLSNGKMSLGGPQQTNRMWWSRTVSGGIYYYRKTENITEVLFDLEIKTENILGVKLQFISRIKKMLPHSTVRIGDNELLGNIQEKYLTSERECSKGKQNIGTYYKSPNSRILDSNL